MRRRRAWGLVLGLALVANAAVAQDDPWPDAVRTPAEDAPSAPASVAPTTAAAPATVVASVAAPAPVEAAATTARPLFLTDLEGGPRYGLLLLVLLAAYFVPALLYPTLLSATTLSPGRGAAVCLGAGAVFIAFPGVLAVLAREQFVAGAAVPWFKQTGNLPLAAGCAGALLVLAALAWRTRATRGDA